MTRRITITSKNNDKAYLEIVVIGKGITDHAVDEVACSIIQEQMFGHYLWFEVKVEDLKK